MPVVLDDMPAISYHALSDYCGNIYMPSGSGQPASVGNRLQHMGENNVRAYLEEFADFGTWNDGDEIVMDRKIYRRVGGSWYEIASLFPAVQLGEMAPDFSDVPDVGTKYPME